MQLCMGYQYHVYIYSSLHCFNRITRPMPEASDQRSSLVLQHRFAREVSGLSTDRHAENERKRPSEFLLDSQRTPEEDGCAQTSKECRLLNFQVHQQDVCDKGDDYQDRHKAVESRISEHGHAKENNQHHERAQVIQRQELRAHHNGPEGS